MTAPRWLSAVLAENTHLNLEHVDGRSRMAEAILASIPLETVIEAIRESSRAVLESRNVRAGAGEGGLADEIGRNATHSVLLLLSEDE